MKVRLLVNFYASPEYLEVVANTYFDGRKASIEDVQIGDCVLRLLVVDGKRIITQVPFLDYHQPLDIAEIRGPARSSNYAESVVRSRVSMSKWEAENLTGFSVAPYVDWSKFDSYDDYIALLKSRRKGLFKEQMRRRRRLAEKFGELTFRLNDEEDDVFKLAINWKGQQLINTGRRNYFLDPKNINYFENLRRKKLLTSSTLRAGTRLMAIWLGFVHDMVWSGWVFTHDPDQELRKYSVGHQLLHSMLEQSYKCNHREFDFSVGGEDYKWFYSTNCKILSNIGQQSLKKRIVNSTFRNTKTLLSRFPKIYRIAESIKLKMNRLN